MRVEISLISCQIDETCDLTNLSLIACRIIAPYYQTLDRKTWIWTGRETPVILMMTMMTS